MSINTLVLILACFVIGILTSACKPPAPESNEGLASGIFFATTDRDWRSGVTNITIAKVKYGTGFRTESIIRSRAMAIREETDAKTIEELLDCFQSRIKDSPSLRVGNRTNEWHIFIYSRENGKAHVRLKKTVDSDVLLVEVLPNAASVTI
jgi:hypothetical protein